MRGWDGGDPSRTHPIIIPNQTALKRKDKIKSYPFNLLVKTNIFIQFASRSNALQLFQCAKATQYHILS